MKQARILFRSPYRSNDAEAHAGLRPPSFRVYQNRVMYKPSFVERIMASRDVVPVRRNRFIGMGPKRPCGDGAVAWPVDRFPASLPAVYVS